MTTVQFKLRTPEGVPITGTWFRIEPGYQDSVVQGEQPKPVEFVTDSNGEASVVLIATVNPYFITKSHKGDDYPVAFKFFVPASTLPLAAEVLFVDLGTHLRLKNDASLAALIDAKVAVLAAYNQLTTVLLPRIAALEAKTASL
jgi:hypothetical protein